MKALFARLINDDSGEDLIEYGLLIGIITAACVTTVGLFGAKVEAYFTGLNGTLP